MAWSEKDMESIFTHKTWQRGRELAQYGRVTDFEVSEDEKGNTSFTCNVTGNAVYRVSVKFSGEYANVNCDCDDWRENKCPCRHMAASMITYIKSLQSSVPLASDATAKMLLSSFLSDAEAAQASDGTVYHITPRVRLCPSSYPLLSFNIGNDKMYVIKDIVEFLKNVKNRSFYSYGKRLAFRHNYECFDERSQRIIDILMDQYSDFLSTAFDPYSDYYSCNYGYRQNKNEVRLTGSSFDKMFDLIKDSSWTTPGSGSVLLCDGEPQIRMTLSKTPRAAMLVLNSEEGELDYFGSVQELYIQTEDRIMHCGAEFRKKVRPFLDAKYPMRIAFSDLPLFCGRVLPNVQDCVEIDDPDSLLEDYAPDECTPCYYFDMDEDRLILKLSFKYGNKTFDFGAKSPPGIKRDLVAEMAAQNLAERSFTHDTGSNFVMCGDDDIYDFLSGSFDVFNQSGEVYVTDRLRAKRITPGHAGVGISVSNGIISLDIDTGGFPPEELEDLYNSLLKKKRYHRLSDGRYLDINGSACETLAEITHMLQLTPKDLKDGNVRLPAFRSLYLDSALSGNEGLEVKRDRQFRSMIRSFKSVSDSDYTVPDEMDGVLRPYQKTGFRWLKTLESCSFGGILADEMGLGKTIEVMAFLLTAKKSDTGRTSLIVCPASLILNWMDEFAKFAPSINAVSIMGNVAERKKTIQSSADADVWVTSYELLRQDIEQYSAISFYCCVLDEAQHVKNQSTLISKAVKRIECQQRFVLTGTPIENRLSELWNLFDFLMPGYLFSHRSFVEKLEKPVVKSGDKDASEQLRKLVKPFMLRRLKSDVLKELPPKTEFVRRVQLSDDERKVYYASSAEAKRKLAAGESGKLAILAALTQLRQICCAPQLAFDNYTGPDSKLDAVMELCAGMVENGHQILLFSQFTSMLDIIRTRLNEAGISNFTLQGSTTKEKRAQLVKSFNSGGASVFLISLKAGGTGLNLTAADIVIHYDPWWNIAAQNQATDRAHRIGQQARVQVYKFIAKDTIEEKIMELQSAKAALMDTISEGNESSILDMSKEELLALFD